jgi:stearoyl-CoA desaturase (delta-9 desaturase)
LQQGRESGASQPGTLSDILYLDAIPFAIVHVACFAVIWTGVRWIDVAIAVGLYAVRMFATTAGYHRYFSHRTFKTGRTFQFVLAFLAESTAQMGVLWWASHHRKHHRHSDEPEDVHSPRQFGFWFSHVGWIFSRSRWVADYSLVPDLARYPEIRWIDKHYWVPPATLALAVWLAAGWSGLVVGFLISTVIGYHATFTINSLAHVMGRQRYVTGDDSRNSLLLALLTLGEGWHNNHHFFQGSVRQGFRWWEIDPTYYVLRGLAALGIVWDLQQPPRHVVSGERRLSPRVVDKAARQLVGALGESSPEDPSLEARARQIFPPTPSLDDIVTRAQEILASRGVSRQPAS